MKRKKARNIHNAKKKEEERKAKQNNAAKFCEKGDELKMNRKKRRRTKKTKEISTHFNDSNVNPTQYQIVLESLNTLSFHFDYTYTKIHQYMYVYVLMCVRITLSVVVCSVVFSMSLSYNPHLLKLTHECWPYTFNFIQSTQQQKQQRR